MAESAVKASEVNDWGQFVRAAYTEAGFCSKKSKDFCNDAAAIYSELASADVWLGPRMVCDYARDHLGSENCGDVHVLDFGCGTGQLGTLLRETGFTHVDAVEPAEAMLAQVPKGVYEKAFPDTASVPDESYHMIMSTGVIGTHVDLDGVKDLLAKVQSGGSLMFTCKHDAYEEMRFATVAADRTGRTWRHDVIHGPVPLSRSNPDQNHVIVRMDCES